MQIVVVVGAAAAAAAQAVAIALSVIAVLVVVRATLKTACTHNTIIQKKVRHKVFR